MKYLLVLVVVVVGLWLMLRQRPAATGSSPPRTGKRAPAEMVACAHCDLRLPRTEAVFDAEGRPYCGGAHLRAGPHAQA